jgi:hypothetical protein
MHAPELLNETGVLALAATVKLVLSTAVTGVGTVTVIVCVAGTAVTVSVTCGAAE